MFYWWCRPDFYRKTCICQIIMIKNYGILSAARQIPLAQLQKFAVSLTKYHWSTS